MKILNEKKGKQKERDHLIKILGEQEANQADKNQLNKIRKGKRDDRRNEAVS